MTQFNMVIYHIMKYPSYIPLHLEEVAGHFDIGYISPTLPYSLHTEYSYGKRLFKNALLEKYPEIIQANKNGIPQLWKSKIWARMFAEFLIDLPNGMHEPDVIEIHPPFNDYMGSIKEFVEIYKIFESLIKTKYPY